MYPIDRQAAIDALQNETNKFTPPFNDVEGSIRCGVRLARNIIEDLPSAQPEIIRCKECKHWISGYITDRDDFIPPKCGKYQQMVGHNSSDYCSLAEAKEDADD